MLTNLWAFSRQVYDGYVRHHAALRAAAISYWALISLIPLLLLAVALLGILLQSNQSGMNATASALTAALPVPPDLIISHLQDIQSSTKAVGITGLLALVWTGSQLFHVLADALNHTWQAPRNRPFWAGRLVALGMMAVGAVFLLGNLTISVTTHWAQARRLPGLNVSLQHLSFVWQALTYIVPLLLSIAFFTLTYWLLPNTRVTWRESLVGGVFGGVLWEGAKVGFGLYIREIGARGYSRLYGSLGGIVILVIWVYYTANILVLGGEVAHTWCEWKSLPDSGARRRSRSRVASRSNGTKKKRRIPRKAGTRSW